MKRISTYSKVNTLRHANKTNCPWNQYDIIDNSQRFEQGPSNCDFGSIKYNDNEG